MNALKRYLNAKRYQAKLNLLAKVVREVAPVLEAMRKADDLLDRTTQAARGIESQGYVADLAKYGARVCRIVTPDNDNGDVARSNDTWQSVRVSAMDKAQAEISPVLV